jgi:endonuclease/exonuclease/phosphatase family metal-dependent hydrolase
MAGLPETLPERLMVVTANLQLIDQPADPQAGVFVRRIETVLRSAPDILLLQEVDVDAAGRVAQLLSDRLGLSYDVASAPSDPVVIIEDDHELMRDTAVLMCTDTVDVEGEPLTVAAPYDPIDAGRFPLRVKEQSLAGFRKRASGLGGAVASVHFVTNNYFTPPNLGFYLKRVWVEDLVAALEGAWPRAEFDHVIAGDFNNRRCVSRPERVKCQPWPFWDVLTRHHGYLDAVLEVHGSSDADLRLQYRKGKRMARTRIDYVFTPAEVVGCSHDTDYGATRNDRDFYSDHRLLWALLELGPSGEPEGGSHPQTQ